jgi:hypothetical protein
MAINILEYHSLIVGPFGKLERLSRILGSCST